MRVSPYGNGYFYVDYNIRTRSSFLAGPEIRYDWTSERSASSIGQAAGRGLAQPELTCSASPIFNPCWSVKLDKSKRWRSANRDSEQTHECVVWFLAGTTAHGASAVSYAIQHPAEHTPRLMFPPTCPQTCRQGVGKGQVLAGLWFLGTSYPPAHRHGVWEDQEKSAGGGGLVTGVDEDPRVGSERVDHPSEAGRTCQPIDGRGTLSATFYLGPLTSLSVDTNFTYPLRVPFFTLLSPLHLMIGGSVDLDE
ncbi:hypothetical protein V8F20_009933 [Naviculisporaceae sp. PSN 640]